MAEIVMTADRMALGREYVRALDRLGFFPDYAVWTWRTTREEWQLAIVTRLVDRLGGASRIYDAMFEAADAGLTPPEPEIWSTSLYSPDMLFPQELDAILAQAGPRNAPHADIRIESIVARRSWIVSRRDDPVREPEALDAMWRTFRAAVPQAEREMAIRIS